jgi:hypothetical protein
VLNWNNAGDIAANTTVVPAGGRTGSGPGGAIQDFAVAYNGPTGQAQVVVDVVGYFVENLATALDCVDTSLATSPVAANALGSVAFPACPTGYTRVGAAICGLTGSGWMNSIDLPANNCFGHALATTADTVYAASRCCRVPGR